LGRPRPKNPSGGGEQSLNPRHYGEGHEGKPYVSKKRSGLARPAEQTRENVNILKERGEGVLSIERPTFTAIVNGEIRPFRGSLGAMWAPRSKEQGLGRVKRFRYGAKTYGCGVGLVKGRGTKKTVGMGDLGTHF